MRMKILVSLLFLTLLAVSCAEVSSTGTMKILLHTSASKTMTLGDNILDITKFTVSGEGPGGKTFAVDSTSSSVTLTGIILGEWSIEAVGYNSKGKEVAKGQTDFFLTSSDNTVSITLTTLTGSGSLQLKYDWDEDVTSPSIAICLTPYNENNKLTKTIKPASGTTSCTITISDLLSGFYTVSSVLYNDTQIITGSTEALRIVNSEKTSGTISFKESSSYSSDLTSLNVFRASQTPITGHFSGTSNVENAGEELSISLILDSSYSDSEQCSLTWYLDGSLLQDQQDLSPFENIISFVPQIGSHILNAVVRNPGSQSIGSISYKFSAKASGKKGIAVYLSTITPQSNKELTLESDTLIGALPDEHFCLITPSRGTMRLCSVYNNTLSINSKNSATEEGFSWLTDTNNIFSSVKMTNFVVPDSNNNINILYFNQAKNRIENAYRGGEQARYETEFGIATFKVKLSNLTSVGFSNTHDTAGSFVMVFDSQQAMLEFGSNGTGITTATLLAKPEGKTKLTTSYIKGNRFVLLGKDYDSFYYADWDGNKLTSQWEMCETSYEHPNTIKILNNENLLVSDSNGLSRYSYSKSSGWRYRSSFDSSVKFLDVSDDGMFFWVVRNDNTLETYTTQDNLIHVIGQIKLNKNITSFSRTENYILMGTDDCCLILCQISKGD